MAFEAGTIIARLGLDTKSFDRNIGRLDRVGKKLSRNISLPIAAAGLVVTKLAADFESSFAGVRKTVDATEAQFEKLSQGFRDMAKEIPVNVNELNRVGEAAGQLGIRTENILDFTRTMADLGVATNLSAEQAATSLARLANITGLPQDQFDRLGSTIVALGNNFATTEAEIVEMGLRIAGAGEQIGLAEGQILAISTALSSVGISAEAGGTAISKVMINMASAVSSGGESLQQFASVAGMSGQDFARAFRDDAAAAINSFVVGLGDMQDSGGDVLGTLAAMGIEEVRMRDALLRAASAGDLLSEALDLQGSAWTENTALAEEARKRYETFSSQLTLFWNRLKDIGITLGTSLLPVLRDALDAAQPLVDVIEKAANAFAELPKSVRLSAVGLAGFAAAAGPASMSVSALATGVRALSDAFGKVTPLASRFFLVLQGTGAAATSAAAGGFAALGVAIAGLAVGAHKLGEHARATTSELDKMQDIIRSVFARGDVSSRASDLAREIGVLDRHGVLAADSMEKLRAKLEETGVVMGRTADETIGNLSSALQKAVDSGELLRALELPALRDPFEVLAEYDASEAARETEELFKGLVSGADAAADEVAELAKQFEALTFEGMAQQAQLVDKALGRLKGTLPIEELRKLRDEWEPWLSRLGVTAPELEKVIVQANKLREAGKKLLSDFLEKMPVKAPELDLSELTKGMDEFSRASEKLPKHLLTLGAGLSNAERAALGMPPVIETMSEKTEAFGKSLQGTSVLLNSFESDLGKALGGGASFTQGLSGLFSSGEGGFSFGNLSKQFRKEGVMSFGSFMGGIASSLPAIGQLVGPAIALLGKLFKPKWKKLGEQGARLFGKEFSKKLSKELLKSQKALGSFQNAVAANIGNIAQEVGVNAKNLGQTMQSLNILIGMVENGTVKWAEAAGQLDKAFGPIKDRLIEMGTEGVFQLGRLIERMRELGKVSADVQAFIQEKASSAVEAMMVYFENLANQEDLTAEKARELVGVVATAFQAAIAAGGGLLGAVQQLGPAFGEVIQKLRGVLGDDNPLLNQITRFYNFVSNNQEQLSAISALGTAFKELAAIGLINAANIEDFSGTFRAEFDKILASTGDQTAALAAMGPQIGLLLEGYRELGMQVPPWLEELAAKAKEAGVNLTPPEDTIDIFRDIRDMLGELVDALKGVGDEARRAGSALSGMGGGSVPQPHFDDGIPGAANEAFVPRRPGGHMFRVGEGAENEYILKESTVRNLARGGGTGGGGGAPAGNTTIHVSFPGVVTANKRELANAIKDAVGLVLRDRLGNAMGSIEKNLEGTFQKSSN